VRRELAIALRARATWLVAAIAALLVGHGFVLAVDLFSSASRSALVSALQAKEMDPLLGVIRPTLGGVELAVALLAPLIATRVVAAEKERGGFGALCLQVGSPTTVLVRKSIAAMCAASFLLLPAIACLLLYRAVGGHVDLIETSVALVGGVLHLGVVVAASIAAAAWTSTFAQAATIAILVSLTSWMIDAGEGFAALAWLGRAESWSIERQIAPFHRGVVAIGPGLFLVIAIATGIGLALIGGRIDWPHRRRVAAAVPVAIVAIIALSLSSRLRRAFDWTEERRASLPPAVVASLRAIPARITLDVRLDRDDSRRRQLESDVLAKLRLARPDVDVAFPLDDRDAVVTSAHDDRYGVITIRVGDAQRETRSTSRKELTTLILEAARRASPDWTMPPYPGFPAVVEGAPRRVLAIAAYGLFPAAFLAVGILLSRRRTGR
jgi:hypothetical protein